MMDRMPFYFDELPQPPLFGGVGVGVSDESARDDSRDDMGDGGAPHDKPHDKVKQEPKQPPKQPPKQTFKQDLLIETPQKQKSQKPKDHNRNHRQRLRSRFMRAGKQALQDYELLELIMFRAIPRRDIKPLAKTLLAEFGDFNRVISAPSSRLLAIKGVGESVIQEFRIVTAAAERLAQVEVLNRDILSDTKAMITYCHIAMAHKENEEFRILFLDRKCNLIADEEQQKGTIDHVPVYRREVVKRALELNASSVILVHNHPSGDPKPSKADVELTRHIQAALDTVKITLHDHIIIGAQSHASMHDLGLLD